MNRFVLVFKRIYRQIDEDGVMLVEIPEDT